MADVKSGRKLDQGTGYGRAAQHVDDDLVRVGPGTPCGELMRRYWHPIALTERSDHAAAQSPHSRRRFDPVPRPQGPAGFALPALHASRHDAVLRQGRG